MSNVNLLSTLQINPNNLWLNSPIILTFASLLPTISLANLLFPQVQPKCINDSAILDILLNKHDKNRLPSKGVVVSVELWVQEISKIIEQTSEFELDIYMTERWLDPTLAFQGTYYDLKLTNTITVRETCPYFRYEPL